MGLNPVRKFLASLLLGLILALGGCGGQYSVHDPAKSEQATPVQKVQAGIDQVKAGLTVLVEGAIVDRKAGVYNDEEWAALKGKLNEAKRHVDTAQGYLNAGDLGSAAGRMALANVAISIIKTELIKRKE